MRTILFFTLWICSITFTGAVTACTPEDTETQTENPVKPEGNNENNNGENNTGEPGNENSNPMKIQVKINSNTFTATLHNNPAAAAFKAMLPISFQMDDVNRNEKFYSLPNSLPTAASNPGTIQTGDLMLYGSSGLVLFYKTFSTSYSYTRIGAIDNTAGLESTLGTGSIDVTFEEID